MSPIVAPHGPLPKIPKDFGTIQLGALIYNEMDLLDLMGPMRIFGEEMNTLDIKINFISVTMDPVESSQQVKVNPHYTLDNAPKIDLLFIPGGVGDSILVDYPERISRIKTLAEQATWVFTVCTGSSALALTGLLDGYNCTTNKAFFAMVIPRGPKVNWIKRARWVQDGKYVTSSGVSAGIDAALYIISELVSLDVAEQVSKHIEYTWHRDAAEDPFADMYPHTRISI
ncbi:hypothetical protein BG011_001790 [Mortierella polycephala]|uniref:DJ-1/PfpI domain-containing protein n=1 Tax=Mortierella polycephala TaxID=41804 RepID=A0A9P6QGD0_9FUNG|nr:hypothetical protein BG011_001790 [Mortierella polycephala]